MLPVPSTAWTWLLLATAVTAPPPIAPQGFSREAPDTTVRCDPTQRHCGERLLSRGAFTVISLLCMTILGGLVGAKVPQTLMVCADVIRVSSPPNRPQEPSPPVFCTCPCLPTLPTLDVLRLLSCCGQVWSGVILAQHLSRSNFLVYRILPRK